MRNTLLLLSLFFPFLLMSQFIELTIIDKETNEPISDVNVVFSNSDEGTISNLDGKIKVGITSNVMTLSHITYKTLKLKFQDLDSANIVYLSPANIVLDEVVVYNLDLKEKLRQVLSNYDNLYVNGDKTYQCTYKEGFRVNDSLVRLFQTRMQWWNSNYRLDFEAPFDKQNQVKIEGVDYSKLELDKNVFGGSLVNRDFFNFLHLDYYLYVIINLGKGISINSIEKIDDFTKIVFDASIEENEVVVGDLKKNEIYFNNETGAIHKLITKFIPAQSNIQKGITRVEKLAFSYQSKTLIRYVSFVNHGDKLRLNQFRLQDIGEVKYEKNNAIFKIENQQNLYITMVELGKKIPKKERIDLKLPFHESLPEFNKSIPKIILTNEEQEFINE